MSRTIQDVLIVNRSAEEVETVIREWLQQNGFVTWLDNSDGSSFTDRRWWQLLGHRVVPKEGSTVAIKNSLYGCIVFETLLEQREDDTNLHGEFYALGDLAFMSAEWDLKPKPPLLGMLPRKEGYRLMLSLFNKIDNIIT